MVLLVRDSFIKASALVMIGNRSTRKTLDPKLATLSETYLLAPCTMETTMISVETDKITPSRVKNERSLWVRRVSSAISTGSFNETRRRAPLLGAPLELVFWIGFS